MNLEFAIVQSCDPAGCRVEYLDGSAAWADYSAPVRERIRIRPGQLVAVDRATEPPQIVWRLMRGKVHAVEGDRVTVSRLDGDEEVIREGGTEPWLGHVTPVAGFEQAVAVGDIVFYTHDKVADTGHLHDVAAGGRPAHAERLAAALFPEVAEYYAGLGQR